MATTINDIPNLTSQIDSLKKEASGYQNKLNTSNTALGGEGTPTSLDVSNQTSLQKLQSRIQTLNDQKLRTQWYGTDEQKNAKEEGTKLGMIGSALDFLTRPLYIVAGATKHFIGQGKGSLYGDIADNMVRDKSTFGDILRTSNVPGAVSTPLGFALDIALDPVNWATMGTGALVPKVFMGAVKGVKTGEGLAKGLSIATKAGVLEKATTLGKFTPFFRKSEAFANLGAKSIKATEAWEKMSGYDLANVIANKDANLLGVFRQGLKKVSESAIKATPGGENFIKHFVYDPVDWVRQARIKDIMQQSLGVNVDLKGAINAHSKGESMEPFLKEATAQAEQKMKEMKAIPEGQVAYNINMDGPTDIISPQDVDKKMTSIEALGLGDKVEQASPLLVKDADDAASVLLDDSSKFTTLDPMENALRITNEKVGGSPISLEDISKIVNSGALDQTGVKWFDNMMKGIRDYTIKTDRNIGKIKQIGKVTMDSYDKGMSIFRVAKVAASPSSWVNAVVGNMLMTHMAGASIGGNFLKRLGDSFTLNYRQKSGKLAYLDGLMMDAGGGEKGGDLIRRALAENKTAASGSLGDTSYLGNPVTGRKGLSNYVVERVSMQGIDAGIIKDALNPEEVNNVLADIARQADMKTAETLAKNRSTVSLSKRAIREKGIEGVTSMDLGTGMASQELFSNKAASELFEYIAEKAAKEPDNKTFKVLNYIFNKAPEGYEKIDQTFKMATFLSATVDGYTMNELRKISKLIDINPEEIRTVLKDESGKLLTEKRYAISGRNALELSNVMYLNYAAMPSAVKVMRNLPLLGSPFVSFMYGMTIKTGQTLAYNPAAFNKVGFAMTELGGSKTPLEKKALDSSYYSYLKQPGMMRMPFFDKNPIYMNMASMIPYYSLNMFNPTQTDYGSSAKEQLVQTVQSSPLMKDPLGSTLFDYFIQPLILGEAIEPQGQFGQPLYPVDANAIEKVGYGARTLGEAFVPNVASFAGLLTPEAAAPYIPSYRWRQLAMAKNGKNQLGISSKEDASSRRDRAIAQALGISVQAPVNTNFAAKDNNSINN
jgi:hypothetical protein